MFILPFLDSFDLFWAILNLKDFSSVPQKLRSSYLKFIALAIKDGTACECIMIPTQHTRSLGITVSMGRGWGCPSLNPNEFKTVGFLMGFFANSNAQEAGEPAREPLTDLFEEV